MSAPQPSLQLDAALQARDRGWRPFPLDHPSLDVCAGIPAGHNCQPKDRGKHPCVAFGTACHVEPTDGMLRHWWSGGLRNLGIACGPSGLVVVDEDELDALEHFARDQREKLPKTYRVMTSRGWHWYFTAPDDLTIGNTAGLLAAYGCDVRGGKGGGGYVVGAGSEHLTGHIYIAEDPFIIPAELPDWLATAILTKAPREVGPGAAGSMSASPMVDTSGAWTDDPRYGTTDQLYAQYLRHLGEVNGVGDQFRHSLYLAALDGWRLVDCGVIDRGRMAEDLRARVAAAWGAPPDERDRQIVNVEARTKATESPWVVLNPVSSTAVNGQSTNASPMPVTHSDDEVDTPQASSPPTIEDLYQLELAAEVKKERLRRDARRQLALEDREPFVVLDLEDFLNAEPVDYLIDGMLWKTGTSRIFGPPGETKSFLAMDIALTLASGHHWSIGDQAERDPVVVHYVMAEGQAVNTQRANAWFAHHGVDKARAKGKFRAIPQGVLLTPEGIAQYLEMVQADQPAWVVLDTKARMMAGDENTAADAAILVRALDEIKEACGGNVTIVDHTGLADKTRARGSSAVLAAMDTEICVTLDHETRIATAEVTRDKAAEAGRTWSYRLKPVELRRNSGLVMPAAVPVPVSNAGIAPFGSRQASWWQYDIQVPEEVAQLNGAGADAARDMFRVLLFVSDPDGIPFQELRRGVNAHPDRNYAETTARRARTMLLDAGVVTAVTATRVALDPRYAGTKVTLT